MRAALGGVVLAVAVVPASASAAKKPAKLAVAKVGGVPVSVAPGDSFTLTGRVVGAKNRRASTGRLRFSLRTLQTRKVALLRSSTVKKVRAGKRRSFARRLTVPASTANGTYLVYACVKRTKGGRFRCVAAKGRLTVVRPVAPPVTPVDNRSASEKLREAITAAGMTDHLHAFQRIADTYGGNRASGLPGYQHSVEYVVDALRAAGYQPRTQLFPFVLYTQNGPATFARTDTDPDQPYVEGDDFTLFSYSGSDSVTDAAVTPVDLSLGLGNTSSSGCEASDFASFVAGRVALLQRGTCGFGVKAANAEAAGAVAVIIFNQGNTAGEDRSGPFSGTLSGPVGIPAVSLSYAEGVALSTGSPTVSISADTTNDARTSTNVTADTPTGDPNSVVVVGAHLDSVEEGAGINDNGSGSAFNLELAVQMAKLGIKPVKTVRFAFWGAEESGLIGSTYYVNNLPDAEFDKLSSNINVDMLGSPNHAKFVYDGDFSDTPAPASAPTVNPGAAEIERLFVDYFTSQGIATEPSAFDGRSDYKAFQDNGIPAGGLFSGAEGIKTEAQAAKWGGTAGLAYDPNYHGPGDTIANVDFAGMEQLADGGAHVVATLATRSANPGGGRAAEQRVRHSAAWGKRSVRLGAGLQR